MELTEYEKMRDVQGQHWWWLGRERLLKKLMDKYLPEQRKGFRIADVGSGFGANIPLLAKYGNVYALETDDNCLEHIKQTQANAVVVKWASPDELDMRFNVMLLADVLEHIEDDEVAMQWIANHLLPGGVAFITVPAHMFLWSEMDDVVHHFRRYSRQRLLDIVGNKLDVQMISFYNMILYPVKVFFVAITKGLRAFFPEKPKRSYNDIPNQLVNAVFKSVMYMEASLIEKINMPMGVSLAMVLRRGQ